MVFDPTDLGATIVVAPGQMPGGFLPSPDADCLPFSKASTVRHVLLISGKRNKQHVVEEVLMAANE